KCLITQNSCGSCHKYFHRNRTFRIPLFNLGLGGLRQPMCDVTNQHYPKHHLIMHQNIPSILPIHVISYLIIPSGDMVHAFSTEIDSRKSDKGKSDQISPPTQLPLIVFFIGSNTSPEFINHKTESVQASPNDKLPRCTMP